ncbi:MAG: tyrosine-type recombinase/integrase [Gammaproteobacteria bacterium]
MDRRRARRARSSAAPAERDLHEMDRVALEAALAIPESPAGRRRKPRRATRIGNEQCGTLRLRGSTWRLQYRIEPDANGKRRQCSARIGSRDEMTEQMAREVATRMLAQLVPLRVAPGSSCTWEAWVARYRVVYLPLLRRTSQDSAGSVVRKHLVGAFAGLYLHQISLGRVQSLIARWRAKGAAPATIATRWSMLRRVLRRARLEGLAVGVPAGAHVDLPRSDAVTSGDRVKAFAPEELQQILELSVEPWRTLWQCLAFLGLRISEALALAWSDFDLQAGRVRITRQAVYGRVTAPKTSSSISDRAVPPALLERLRAYHAICNSPDGLLFPGPHKDRPLHASGVRRHHLAPILRKLGIRGRSTHAFRHFFGMQAARAGVPLPALQRALRQKDRRSTELYTTANTDDVDLAVRRVESLYLKSAPAVVSAPELRNRVARENPP